MIDLYLRLRQIAERQTDIRLLNVYKGLPISYDAQIHAVGDRELRVHSSLNQLACLYYQGETFLQVTELPFALRSQVVSLHLGKQDATLTNLEVASRNVGNRSQIRVEPDEPLMALIQFEGAPIGLSTPIADISAEGASVFLEPYMYAARICRPGNAVSVSITLPDSISQKMKKFVNKPVRETYGSLLGDPSRQPANTITMNTTGKITSVLPQPAWRRYRVGMQLLYKDLSRAVILQYISQRQAEIIRGLNLLSQELYNRTK